MMTGDLECFVCGRALKLAERVHLRIPSDFGYRVAFIHAKCRPLRVMDGTSVVPRKTVEPVRARPLVRTWPTARRIQIAPHDLRRHQPSETATLAETSQEGVKQDDHTDR